MEKEEPIYGYVFQTDEEDAKMMGCTVRTIKKYHKQLIEKGILEIYTNEDGIRVKKYKLNAEGKHCPRGEQGAPGWPGGGKEDLIKEE